MRGEPRERNDSGINAIRSTRSGDRLYSPVNAAYGGRIDGISPGAYVLPSKSQGSPARKPFAENSLARGIRTGSRQEEEEEEESVQKLRDEGGKST